MLVASNRPNELSLDVVPNCQNVSDVSLTSANDSIIEQEEEKGEKEDNAERGEEQDCVSIVSDDHVEAKIEPERAEEELESLEENVTGLEEKKEAVETINGELKEEKQQQQQVSSIRTAAARDTESSLITRRPFVPLVSKSWRMRAMESNTQITRLMKAALLQTLLHAIRTGSVEGVMVAIERGVQVQYLDSRQRNLVMLASKCDTEARLHIVVILLDAGCDMNHKDQLGWSCLHYAWYVQRPYGLLDTESWLTNMGLNVRWHLI